MKEVKHNYKRYVYKGLVTGVLFFFAFVFLAGMVTDYGTVYININKYGEGAIETFILFWLAFVSFKEWFKS